MSSFQRLYQDAMLVGEDHVVRTRTPPAVLIKMPPGLYPLHRCAAFVAGRRSKGDQIRPLHASSQSVLPESIPLSSFDFVPAFAESFGTGRDAHDPPFA